jgi:hypothetical protein
VEGVQFTQRCRCIIRHHHGEFGESSRDARQDGFEAGFGVDAVRIEILEALVRLQVDLECKGRRISPVEFHVEVGKRGFSNNRNTRVSLEAWGYSVATIEPDREVILEVIPFSKGVNCCLELRSPLTQLIVSFRETSTWDPDADPCAYPMNESGPLVTPGLLCRNAFGVSTSIPRDARTGIIRKNGKFRDHNIFCRKKQKSKSQPNALAHHVFFPSYPQQIINHTMAAVAVAQKVAAASPSFSRVATRVVPKRPVNSILETGQQVVIPRWWSGR